MKSLFFLGLALLFSSNLYAAQFKCEGFYTAYDCKPDSRGIGPNTLCQSGYVRKSANIGGVVTVESNNKDACVRRLESVARSYCSQRLETAYVIPPIQGGLMFSIGHAYAIRTDKFTGKVDWPELQLSLKCPVNSINHLPLVGTTLSR